MTKPIADPAAHPPAEGRGTGEGERGPDGSAVSDPTALRMAGGLLQAWSHRRTANAQHHARFLADRLYSLAARLASSSGRAAEGYSLADLAEAVDDAARMADAALTGTPTETTSTGRVARMAADCLRGLASSGGRAAEPTLDPDGKPSMTDAELADYWCNVVSEQDEIIADLRAQLANSQPTLNPSQPESSGGRAAGEGEADAHRLHNIIDFAERHAVAIGYGALINDCRVARTHLHARAPETPDEDRA